LEERKENELEGEETETEHQQSDGIKAKRFLFSKLVKVVIIMLLYLSLAVFVD